MLNHHRNVRFDGSPIINPFIDFDMTETDVEIYVDGEQLCSVDLDDISENQLEALKTTLDTIKEG